MVSVFAAVIKDISVENVAEKMCEQDAGNVHPKEKLYSCKVPGFGKAILKRDCPKWPFLRPNIFGNGKCNYQRH